MNLSRFIQGSAIIVAGLNLSLMPAQAINLNLIASGTPEEAANSLISALLGNNSGINVVPGSATFTGRIGSGNLAQSATYTNFNLVPNNAGLPTISNPKGIFLTSGVANIPFTNTDFSFDNGSVGTIAPDTGSDADLAAILTTAGLDSNTNDVNFLKFDFTLADTTKNSVSAQFVFGSDEFPDQSVTDVFGFFVDGTNYAFFQDRSLVSFVTGVNATQFNGNNVGTNNYNLEYDGISKSLEVVGLLNPNLSTHTLKIAIADTADTFFDSGVFIGNLVAGDTSGGGGVDPQPNPTDTPESSSLISLIGLGILGVASAKWNKK